MKIQLALDRVSIEDAVAIIEEAKEHIDIIEIGTSLFLDYGQESLLTIKESFDHTILVDIKTMDEAEYEFRRVFENGADIATVMGASAIETIRICQQTALEFNKDYMIDSLEINDEKIQSLTEFEDAIICLHLPKDKKGDLKKFVENFTKKHQLTNRLAAAGGIKLEDIPYLKEAGIDIVVVGSAITKSDNIGQAAKAFKESI